MRFLRKRLDALQVIASPLGDTAKVWFGAWVGVEDESGEVHQWRIVGPDEFDLNEAKISCDSPLGRSLLGKEIDAEIELETPSGVARWTLVSIRYTAP